MAYEYTLNCGQYVLTEDGKPIGRVLDEVSIALDIEHQVMHKHGSPEMVQAWLQKTQAKLRAGGAGEMADQLVVLTGRFPLEELNKCLAITGYAGRLYAAAVAGTLQKLPYGSDLAQTLPQQSPAARRVRP